MTLYSVTTKVKTDLSKYDNSSYSTQASSIKKGCWYLLNILFLKNPLNPFTSLKVFFLKSFGAKVGKQVVIKPSVNIKYPWLLEIGHNVWIGENVWIDNLTKVIIQNNVVISQGAMLLTGSHNYTKPNFDLIVGEIILEEGVWIGAKSIVCPGVICKTHSVLAVNSVATKNLEPYFVYQGNPAEKKRERIIQ
ncbi:colanic acid biosynthesis acetyltransferase WcaF [Rhodocytophaga rosea]|uniref:Colanic acid biosynthesis acetyltransferase WcaF n=1 Tax=Rhodocytophaga rosea TaxID=2704465 RepID=A0A6C0GCP4_9BACT|nr:WcaF family extracellular polysaccharide biosynthesis acetyltransferase [Rhodocytophaga rosea]QHT65759.1 colanic acid biosynthesis acetyltransferase WcaF [Rhodocytophaga rosea]